MEFSLLIIKKKQKSKKRGKQIQSIERGLELESMALRSEMFNCYTADVNGEVSFKS